LHIEVGYDGDVHKDDTAFQETLYRELADFVSKTFDTNGPEGGLVELEYGVKREPQPTELEVFIDKVERALFSEVGLKRIAKLCREWREKKDADQSDKAM
jgi:hypothetical protein